MTFMSKSKNLHVIINDNIYIKYKLKDMINQQFFNNIFIYCTYPF